MFGHVRTTFGSWDVEIEVYKVLKTDSLGRLLEVEMSKKCMLLSREANFQVKVCKTQQVLSIFGSWDVEKVHAVVARSTFRSQKWKKLRGWEHFWTFGCLVRGRHQGFCTLPKVSKTWGYFVAVSTTPTTPLHIYTTLHYTILRYYNNNSNNNNNYYYYNNYNNNYYYYHYYYYYY